MMPYYVIIILVQRDKYDEPSKLTLAQLSNNQWGQLATYGDTVSLIQLVSGDNFAITPHEGKIQVVVKLYEWKMRDNACILLFQFDVLNNFSPI